ncbi:Hsp70 family protein [Glycomyces sp. NRRL B-16210]|uniref:Hsp70 family protein n=1 Tax=Glycomyces sp. NRRL B-16210 TaxID=1463821 RepID=UPI0004C0ADD6|nr:Hsp70 family protein [Glycomyces sp. NRRL B-16210]
MSTAWIDPAAAAASLTASGATLEPGAALAVYRLGRTSFRTAVVRRVDDAYVVVAERSQSIGGDEFDDLLLAYLSGRHRDADRRFWDRLDGTDEADLRLRRTLLAKIKRAREQLSGQDFTVITLPVADLKLSLTREELESRLRGVVEETVDLTEEALAEAGTAPQALAGLLIVGGAGRTPLASESLRRRFGVEPVHAAGDVRAVETPVETRELPVQSEEPEAPRPRSARPLAILVALLVLVGAVAAFGTRLGDHEPPSGSGAVATAPGEHPEPTGAIDPTETDPGGSGGEESPSSPSPESEEVPADPTKSQPAGEATTTSSPRTGPVPDVVGLSTAEAVAAMDEAGFAEVDLEGQRRAFLDFSHDDCEVIEQSPAPGTNLQFASAVTVTFSHSGDEEGCEA